MKKRKIITLGAGMIVFAALTGAYFFLKMHNTTKEESEETTEILAVESEAVEELTFRVEEEDVTFVKTEDGWKKAGEEDFPVNADKVTDIVSFLSSVNADRVLNDVEDFSQYGLDSPSNIIKVKTSDGQEEILRIGDLNTNTNQYYVEVGEDTNTVYTVAESDLSVFTDRLYDYASGQSFPTASSGNITRVLVEKQDNPYVIEKWDKSTSGWGVGSNDKDIEGADSGAVGTYTGSIAGLAYEDFVDYNCTDLSVYGLDQPQASVTVDYQEEVMEEEDSSESSSEDQESVFEDRTYTLYIGNKTEDESYYVNLKGSSEVYTMAESRISEMLDKKPSDFWDMTVNYVPITEVNDFTVKRGDQTYEFHVKRTKETNEEGEEITTETYYWGEDEVNENNFKTFYSSTINLSAQSRLTEPYEQPGQAELEFTYVNQKQEVSTVKYYPYDNNFYTAVKENGKVYLVNKMNVKNMMSLLETLVGEQNK